MRQLKLIYLIVITLISLTPPAFAVERLVFSVDLVRHGDRTPLHEIPNSPYPWKEGLGELTDIGKQQELELGKHLRDLYILQYHLLPDIYDERTIYVKSTDFKRAIDSATALLLGLYPTNKRPDGSNIVVNTFPQNENNILTPRLSYNILARVYLYFWEKNAWHETSERWKDKLELWCTVTGMPLNNFKELGHLADNLYVRQLHHVDLPAGISKADAKIITTLGENGIVSLYKFKVLTYLMGYLFLNTVDQYFEQAMAKKTALKYVLFLGHDSTIMSVMNTMGVPFEKLPKYASRLNFSLYEDNNNYYVKVTLNDQPVNIRACGGR